jgi:hypothetical protein
MASKALKKWRTQRRAELNELLEAHRKVGGTGPGRRYATQQLNYAFMAAVAAQFQGFCRDLHSETVSALATVAPPELAIILVRTFTKNRRLDQGNANEANIAEDFARIGMKNFWEDVTAQGGATHTQSRRRRLEQMNLWRNAIAHNDFEQNQCRIDKLDGRLRPQLVQGKWCRQACKKLASQIDQAVAAFLTQVVGSKPW